MAVSSSNRAKRAKKKGGKKQVKKSPAQRLKENEQAKLRMRKRRGILEASKKTINTVIQPGRVGVEATPESLTEIGEFVKELHHIDINRWRGKILQRIEVAHIFEIVLPNNTQKMQEMDGRGNRNLMVKTSDARRRFWSIWWKGLDEKRTLLFEVRQSTIPNAGYGLFAGQDFKIGEVLGVYYGDRVVQADEIDKGEKNEYTFKAQWARVPRKKSKTKPAEKQTYFVTPKGGAGPDLKEAGNVFFGIHMANDPSYIPRTSVRPQRAATKRISSGYFNISVRPNLTVMALRDIKAGEELFLDYNLSQDN